MAAGSIIVDLLMRTGSFETDTARAAKTAEKRAREIEASFKKAGTVIGAAIGAGVTTAAVAFDQLVKQAADFKDLEEITGSTAEDIASLAVASATAGIGIEDLAGQMNRLTKSLSSVDDESKGAGAALANLGIPLDEFKKLDPVKQIDALSKAFAGFKDGPEKTANAMALFGKQGAEMLKVFKALEEQGGRQKILSQEQIELADAYADAQARSLAELKLYSAAAATQALPAVNDLVTAFKDLVGEVAGIDKETGKLAGNDAVKRFAEGAIDVLAFLVDAGRGVAQVFNVIGTSAGAGAAALAAVARGDVQQAIEIARQGRADIDAILSAESFRDKLARARAASAANPVTPTGDTRPELPSGNLDRPNKSTKAQTNDADKLLKSLQDQYVATLELSNVEKALIAIRSDGFKGLTPEYERLILEQAAILDQDKELEKQFRATQDALDDAAESGRSFTEAGLEIFEATRTPLEKLNQELERLNRLQQQGALDWETYKRAVEAAQDAFTKTTDTGKQKLDELDTFTKRAAENIQDALGDQLYQVAKGNFDNIGQAFGDLLLRMLAQAQAAQLGKALFGNLVGGEGNGLLGTLISAAAGAITGIGTSTVPRGDGSGTTGDFSRFDRSYSPRAIGGPVTAGQDYWVGEHGPERFTPSSSGRILPNSELAGPRVSLKAEIINNTPSEVRTEQRSDGGLRVIIDQVRDQLGGEIMNGRGLARPISQRFGLNSAAGLAG